MKIWIFNHYATNQYIDGTGRHQGLAKYLIRKGHDVKIFCADTVHNSESIIEIKENSYCSKIGKDNVEYVFIKTCPYAGNGLSRMKNMIFFGLRLPSIVRKIINIEGRPDVFLASSVHPLTLVGGIYLKKKYKIPCICEIRDIWPLSLVDFGIISEKSIINMLLQKLELWTYKKADRVIFTMEGGVEYVKDMGWSSLIPSEKILYLNNGVDIEIFNKNEKAFEFEDEDLENNKKKFIYTGSIGMADKLERLVDLAERCNKEGLSDVQFLVYGSGSERHRLEKLCEDKALTNIKFKDKVRKEQVPYVLSKSYANVFFLDDLNIYKYGISLNKFFEYLAAGKPIITNRKFGYNQIDNNSCGFTSEMMFESISNICSMDEDTYDVICKNARNLSQEYSFKCLADKLENYIADIADI